jgi:hypothetical protein
MTKVHDLVHELLHQCNKKILHLEVQKTKLSEKLVGLEFSMENQKATTFNEKNSISPSECEQKKVGASSLTA